MTRIRPSLLFPVALILAAGCGGSGKSSSLTVPPSLGPGEIDLSVSISVDDDTPREQQAVTFEITVENSPLGADATGVEIQSPLPPGLAFQSQAPEQGTYAPVTGVWTLGDLAAGASVKLGVVATVEPGLGGVVLIQGAAVLSSDQVDPNPIQDTATVGLVVDPDADLAVAVALDDASPVRNQPLGLTVTLSNAAGGARASGIAVDLTLTGLVVDWAAPQSGSFDSATGRWSVPLLDSGASTALALVVSVDGVTGGAALQAAASIALADQPDPNPADGSAVAQAVVATEAVELVRDALGVPHVYAQSDQGAFYGAGVATAEDRLSQLLCTRLLFEGRLAEFFGRGTGDEHLDGDRKARLYGFTRQAERALAGLDPETRSLLRSFADGVNSVLLDPATTLQPLFASAGVPKDPWTAADSIATWEYLGTFFGPEALREAKMLHDFEDVLAGQAGDVPAAVAAFASPAVLDDAAAVVPQSSVPADVQQAMSDYAASVSMGGAPLVIGGGTPTPKFSHSWVVAGSETMDGKAVLVSDPRLPVDRPSNLYELHVRGESFEVRGVSFPGCLNLLVGQSPHMAWGGSALGIDQEDLFRLSVDAGAHPGEYEWDGSFRPWETEETETIQVLGEAPVVETYRETLLGPVVTSIVEDAQPGEEYAVRRVSDPDLGPDSSAGFLAMYRAQDVDAFGQALEGFRYPSTNLVFGDDTGRIGYWANGAVPVRSPEQPYAALAGRIAQEGDRADRDWIDQVPHELMPAITDPADGVLFTANHMPVGSWYPITLLAGTGSNGDSNRSLRLRELFAALPRPLDPDAVLGPHFDAVNAGERDLVRLAQHARNQLGVTFSTAADSALDEALEWLTVTGNQGQAGEKTDLQRAVALVSNLKLVLRAPQSAQMVETWGSGTSATLFFLKTRLDEAATLGVADLRPFEISWMDDRLAEAWATTTTTLGPPSAWAAAYAAGDLTLSVPAWRKFGAAPLDPGDVLNLGPLTCTDPATLLSQSEQSFTTRSIVGDVDAGLSVLPFGEAEPGLAHDGDQTSLFVDRTFKPVPMTKAAVQSLAGPTSTANLQF